MFTSIALLGVVLAFSRVILLEYRKSIASLLPIITLDSFTRSDIVCRRREDETFSPLPVIIHVPRDIADNARLLDANQQHAWAFRFVFERPENASASWSWDDGYRYNPDDCVYYGSDKLINYKPIDRIEFASKKIVAGKPQYDPVGIISFNYWAGNPDNSKAVFLFPKAKFLVKLKNPTYVFDIKFEDKQLPP